MPKFPKEFIELCRSITAKRPKAVIDHILKHGHVNTDELKALYDYNHGPRAARDVRAFEDLLDQIDSPTRPIVSALTVAMATSRTCT